jgi:hypothetical protein
MKPFFLSLCLCGVFSPLVLAQETAKSGYENLVAAGKSISLKSGEDGRPTAREPIASDAENLRRQRLGVARNAPALKLLREALTQKIEIPLPKSQEDINLTFPSFGTFRELARQLRQESDVRLADGDAVGAFESRLTGLQLGAAIARDAPHIHFLTGIATSAVARADIGKVVAKLDAAQIRAGLEKLRQIDASHPTLISSLRVEQEIVTRLSLQTLEQTRNSAEARDFMASPEGKREMAKHPEMRAWAELTPDTLKTQIAAGFDAVIAHESKAYSLSRKGAFPSSGNPLVEVTMDIFRSPGGRFSYERHRVQSLLLQSALELRAIKLETGAYPVTFEAPIDPFSNGKPLVYAREGDKYRLYSVGPDGRDDGGSEIQTLETDPDTGITKVSERLQATSYGDILAPIF